MYRFLVVFMVFSYSLYAQQPTLAIGEGSGCKGEVVVVNISTVDFLNMASFQLTISWDTNLVSFVEAMPLEGEVMNTIVNDFFIEDGHLALSWLTTSLNGNSFVDNTNIYALSFQTNDNNGGVAAIQFTEDLIAIDATAYENGSVVDISMVTIDGEVLVSSSEISMLNVIPETGSEMNGAIDIEVMGGVAPYEVDWSNGAMMEDIGGLSMGEYSCTITDGIDCFESFGPFVVDQLSLVSMIENGAFQLFPNPTSDFINFSVRFDEEVTGLIEIWNSIGEKLDAFSKEGRDWSKTIDLRRFEKGGYYLKIQTEEGMFVVSFLKY